MGAALWWGIRPFAVDLLLVYAAARGHTYNVTSKPAVERQRWVGLAFARSTSESGKGAAWGRAPPKALRISVDLPRKRKIEQLLPPAHYFFPFQRIILRPLAKTSKLAIIPYKLATEQVAFTGMSSS